jgi:hypothetical protein
MKILNSEVKKWDVQHICYKRKPENWKNVQLEKKGAAWLLVRHG